MFILKRFENRWGEENAAFLPWTVSVADASALPTMFSATQV